MPTPTPTEHASGRRTQAERSATTRGLLLDATIELLVEVGYANTTTTLIAERAGVSRGAQLHHFPSKAALVAEAVKDLGRRRAEQGRRTAARMRSRGDDAIATGIDLIEDSQRGPLFTAAIELWVASRTDTELREHMGPIEQQLSEDLMEIIRAAFGEEIASRPDFELAVATTLATAEGLAVMRTWGTAPRDTGLIWRFARDQLAQMFKS